MSHPLARRGVRSRYDSRFQQKAKLHRLMFESLEDRQMLAGAGVASQLPAAIVVGRTLTVPQPPDATSSPLPSYFVGEIQGNQLAITYTVYNEAADPETGVLLTTTLETGVTIASASQQPDRNGQNLAWSLGTIPGKGRASVTLTVNLANPAPLQLDSGARAYAILDAAAVSASTPAATLQAGNLSDPSLLASTPDANTSDPFIQEEAAALGYDAANIFNFLHNQIAYNSYLGSVRGARGTLWSGAGNAVDVASLGVALMRASGIPSQYAQGTLSQAQAGQLIDSMFQTTDKSVGAIAPGSTIADPASDPTLLEETTQHYWFQFDVGTGTQNADPLMPGATIGQTVTTSSGTFSAIPASLEETTEIQLVAETFGSAEALFGLGGPQDNTVLDQTFDDVELVGKPITVGNFVNSQAAGGLIFTSVTNTYSPYIEISDEANPDPSNDEVIHGQAYQEVITNFPFGSQILTGLFLNITLSGPQAAPVTFDKTLVDRIGFAARQGAGSVSLPPIDPTGPPILTENDLWTVNALPGLQSPAVIGGELSALASLQAQLSTLMPTINAISSTGPETPDQQAAVSQTGSLNRQIALLGNAVQTIAFALASDHSTAQLESGYDTLSYDTSPRLLVASSHQDGANLSVAIDLVKDDARDIEAPGQAVGVSFFFEQMRGYFDSALEGQVLAATTGQQAVTFDAVTQALAAQGGGLVLITQDNLTDLDGLSLSADAKARITQEVDSGFGVLTPNQMVTIAGQSTVEWLQVNFATGQVISVAPDGGHQAAIEYAFVLDNPINVASIAFIGTMQGFAISQLKFLGLFLSGVASGKDLVTIVRDAKLELATDLAKDYISLLAGAIPVPETLPGWEALGAEVVKSILGLSVGPVLFDKPLNPLDVGKEVIKLILGQTLPGFSNLSLAYDAGLVAGSAFGIYYIATNFPGDPPLFPALTTELASLAPANTATGSLAVTAGLSLPGLSSTVNTASVAVSNQLSASWASSAIAGFQVTALSTAGATVTDLTGKLVGTGAISLATATPIAAAVSGNDQYHVSGTGSLSFYGPAGTRLGVSGDWTTYSANVSGNVSITITTAGLSFDGSLLPAGTYTIAASSTTLAGSGPSTSPNFTGSVSITATNDAVNLGPWTGNLAAAGGPFNPSNVATLGGFSGTISVTANGDGTDAVDFLGNATNIIQVSANPATISTDQNTPESTRVSVATNLTDTYALSASGPEGWGVSLDATGELTITPAPGVQSGTYPIRLVAQSTTDPGLVAQTTINVTVAPTTPGLAFAVTADPIFTVPFNGAELPTAFRATLENLGPAADTYNLTFSNVPTGFTLLDSGTSISVPAGVTGLAGLYLQPNTGQPIPPPGTPLSFTVTATSTTDSAITKSQVVTFTVPQIDAVTLTSDPVALVSSPNARATATLSLTNNGNVSEIVSLAATLPGGVTASGLTQVTVAAGATQTETITLTPSSSVALDTSLSTPIIATYGPAGNTQSSSVQIGLTVRSAVAIAATEASNSAAQAGNAPLASTLSEIGDALDQLQSAPSPALFSRLAFLLGNLSLLVQADPALAPSNTAVGNLISAANAQDAAAVASQAPVLFGQIDSVVAVEAREQFTVALTPAESDLEPTQGEVLSVQLTDTGAFPETLNLTAGALPTGVSVAFGQDSVSLTPGQSIMVPITLTQTLQSASLFTLDVTAAATVAKQTDSAVIAVRPAVADVLSVTVNPSSVTAGDPVSVSAQVFNTANVARVIDAQIAILDASGNPVGTPTDVPGDLVPGTGNLSLNLGQVATTGLADGLYSVNVSLVASDGTPLPGQSSQADFEIGQPVTASVAASATFVPPGTSTVTTTITTAETSGFSGQSLGDIEVVYNATNTFMFDGKPLGIVDGPAFVIQNTSNAAITGGVLSIGPGGVSIPDSFDIGTVAADSYVVIVPGLSNDGQTHPGGGFFANTGQALDTSDSGPNGNNVQFEFTGLQNGVSVDSGVFTPAATFGPSEDDTTSLNFLGGPGDADGPCTNCFGPDIVANLIGASAPSGGSGANSSPITVELAYGDDLRPNPFFPDPWSGSPNTIFDGSLAGGDDAGAILITNNTSAPITVNDVTVVIPNGQTYDLWGSNVVPAGANLILTQTNGENFDTSDFDITLPYPKTYADGETAHASQIKITVNGVLLPTYLDTGHVLTTGGSDPGGSNVNESLNWRPVGTTGEGTPGGTTLSVVVTHNLPASGYDVDPTTITPAPSSSSSSQVVWNQQLIAATNSSVFQLTGTVTDMAPGEVRKISLGTTIAATTTTPTGQQITTMLPLAPVTVAAEHIISIDPPTQTVDRAATATFTVSLTNPLSTDETYNLSTTGLDGLTVGLVSSILVPAGQTVTTPLSVNVPAGEVGDKLIFTVNAQTAAGASDSVEGQLIVSPGVLLKSPAVALALKPTQAVAGQGNFALDQLTVTNVGDVDGSYNLKVFGLPSGIAAALGEPSIDVPPGLSNFRNVSLMLTPATGTAPGNYPFTVTATSTADPTVSSTTSGTLTVVAGGVQVLLNPGSGAPGTSFQATVTNTGTTTDTFDLALAGPAALVSTLGTTQVSLAPGASQVVPISTGPVNFAVPGSLPLTAVATSTTNPAIQGAASADLSIPSSQSMTAEFGPASQSLSQPGMATFLLMVHNTGNTEDSYSATIMGTNGPVAANLIGPDGLPTQAISLFRVPGLSTAAIELQVSLAAVGKGTVTVMVQSLSDAAVSASPVAAVIIAPTITKSISPDGPQVTQVQRFGVHMMPTSLVVTFDQALDPATAQDARDYRIIGPAGRTIRVKSAVYDPTTLTVTLHPARRINIHHRYELIVDGSTPGGIKNASGQLLDGHDTGEPGSDYRTPITWRNLVLDPRGPKATHQSGTKATLKHRPKPAPALAASQSAGLFTRRFSFR